MDKYIKRLCSICIRAGSKGVPSKNIRNLKGKPLFLHSLEQAQKSKLFNVISVSSDSSEILQIANENGADITILRPQKLATDKAAKLPVIKHCFREVEKQTNITFDMLVDLDATSPLRDVNDIKGVVKLLEESKNNINIITGTPSRRSPYFNLVEIDQEGIVHLSGIKKKWEQTVVSDQDNIKIVLDILSKKGQIVFVLDRNKILKGTVTDRDIRENLIKGVKLSNKVTLIMNDNPEVIMENTDEEEIVKLFLKTNLLHLPVIDKKRKLINVRSMETIVRRQDSPECYDLNASVYAWWREGIMKSKNVITENTKLFVMPEERSIDIDSELDFKWVEFLMNNR